MDELQQRQAILKETFDAVAGGYDGLALRFFPRSAGITASLLGLRGDEQVLDVACGTGHAACAIARLLPAGRVTAVDFSPRMLDQARAKVSALSLQNVDLLERDMADLGFPDGRFDAAVCAFGIFFAEDMDAQLARIVSMVRPGGRVLITSFQESYFSPLKERLFDRLLACGIPLPTQTWRRIANEEGCRQLFAQAGLRDIRVERENVGYFLAGPEEWWDIVWNAGFRRMVARLSPSVRERFKQEHLAEVAAFGTEQGIWLDVGVLFTLGSRA